MPDFQQSVPALVATVISGIRQIAPETDGWQTGVEAKYQHDVTKDASGKVSVAVSPALPFPINVGVEAAASQHLADSTNLRYWLYGWGARAVQPTASTPPLPDPNAPPGGTPPTGETG